jgi:hypothetical protein
VSCERPRSCRRPDGDRRAQHGRHHRQVHRSLKWAATHSFWKVNHRRIVIRGQRYPGVHVGAMTYRKGSARIGADKRDTAALPFTSLTRSCHDPVVA